MSQKILFIDDDEDFVALVDYRLKSQNYEISYASSGKEALKILKEQKVDLVILDRRLSDMNGYLIAKQLRNDEKTRKIPIILISGIRQGDEEEICDRFFLKPFDWKKLQDSIYSSKLNLRI